jgi:hypothetical protein
MCSVPFVFLMFAGVPLFNIVVAFAIGRAVLGLLGGLWAGMPVPVPAGLREPRRGESRAGLPARQASCGRSSR